MTVRLTKCSRGCEPGLQLALTVRADVKLLREFNFSELMRDTMLLAVPPNHPLAKKKIVKLEEVVREPLITYSRKDYPEAYKMLVGFFAASKTKPRIVEEHDSVNSLIAAVEAGVGVAIVTNSLKCTAGWRLKFVPFSPALPPIIVGAFWPKKKLSAAAEKFVDCAKETSKASLISYSLSSTVNVVGRFDFANTGTSMRRKPF